MSYILHMSDFHFGRNYDLEEKRLNDLANWILDQRYEINYVVFTGDIIDSFELSLHCISILADMFPDCFAALDRYDVRKHSEMYLQVIESNPLLCEHYNSNLLEHASFRMKGAAETVSNFLGQLGVKQEQFFTCCGNHDRIRFLPHSGSDRPCDGLTLFSEESYLDVYEPYNTFCQKFRSHGDYRTHVREHAGIHFVIADTNWRLPLNQESNNMCIHCGKVTEILESLSTTPGYSKTNTILIAHKPFDDICENVKFPYHGQERTVKEIIEDSTAMYLHGDKHSFLARPKNKLNEFMCGAPLASNRITYNLIDFEPENGFVSSIFINYQDGTWNQMQNTSFMEDIYAYSRNSLNREALNLMTTHNTLALSWGNAIDMLLASTRNNRLNQASEMLRAVGDIRGPRNLRVPFTKDLLFEQVYQLIFDNDHRMPLKVQGPPGTGKSIFLTIEYLYILWKYYAGACNHIPLYINLDSYTQDIDSKLQDTDNKIHTIIEYYMDKIKDTVAKFMEIRKKNCCPICIIIDGLETKNTLGRSDSTLEEGIFKHLEKVLTNTNDKYIMGFNDHIGFEAERTAKNIKNFEYVFFLSHAISVPFREHDRFSQFINNYLTLQGQTNPAKVSSFKNTVGKLRRLEISLNTLHTYYDMLSNISPEAFPWDVMLKFIDGLEDLVERLFITKDAKDTKLLYLASYYLFIKRMPYKNICTQTGLEDFPYSSFTKIRNNPIVAEYLIARHYVDQLENYLEPGSTLDTKSILCAFLPRDLSVMIRLVIDKMGISTRIADAISEVMTIPNTMLYSNIIYLIGHDKKQQDYALIKRIRCSEQAEDQYFQFVQEKSKYLSLICCSPDSHVLSNQYILKLMDNREFRHYHRIFQIHYYEGLSEAQKRLSYKVQDPRSKKKGFDFHDCFLTLVSKLRYSYEANKPYPMMEVDLFTICDLIFARLQQFDPASKDSLFYQPIYNCKEDSLCISIIRCTTALLKEYIAKYAEKREVDDRILAYFEFMQTQLCEVREKLEKHREEPITKPFVSHATDYQKVLDLLGRSNTDWKKVKKHRSNREAIGQHILETIYIAQLFLPDDLSIDGFSKSTVISLILMSEIGKLKIGNTNQTSGYPVHSVPPKNSTLERQGMREMLSLGALDGYAEFKELFPALTANSGNLDINMLICNDLKLIQAEYRYYSFHDELDFADDQHYTFAHMYQRIGTNICKDIRTKLIVDNPNFHKFFNHQS